MAALGIHQARSRGRGRGGGGGLSPAQNFWKLKNNVPKKMIISRGSPRKKKKKRGQRNVPKSATQVESY